MLARAHAQATGQSVEVRYRPGESRVEARFFLPWMMSYQLAAGEPAQDDSSQRSESPGNSASDSAIAEAWASRAISKSVRIGSQRLVNGEGDIRHATSNLDYAAAIEAELTNTDDVRLAVFMPDGTALLNDPFWFEDDGGRVGRLTINPFSGLPAWERLLDLTDPMPTEDEFNSPAGTASEVPNDVGTDHGASSGDGGATVRPR
jgi:hypothetical protein